MARRKAAATATQEKPKTRRTTTKKEEAATEESQTNGKIDFGKLTGELNWKELREHKREFTDDINPPAGLYIMQVTRADFISTKRGPQFKTTLTIRALVGDEGEILDEDQLEPDEKDLIHQTCGVWNLLDNKETVAALGRTQAQMWIEWLDQLGLEVEGVDEGDIEQIPSLLTNRKLNPKARPLVEVEVVTRPSNQDPSKVYANYRIRSLFTTEEAEEFERDMS